MKSAPVIALLGISGVGKSRLAEQIITDRPELLRLSAGEMLRTILNTTGTKLRTAESDRILENQLSLVTAFRAAREGQVDRPVLLEGHGFIDNDRELVDIPPDIMRAMEVAAFLLLEAPPQDIFEWRRHDRRRRRPERTADELARQQLHLRLLITQHAKELMVPLKILVKNDHLAAACFIDKICSETTNVAC